MPPPEARWLGMINARQVPLRTHTESEIKTCWVRVINAQLIKNKINATKIKRNESTLRLVIGTWEPVLKQSLDIPNGWIHNREVLVGRRT